MAAERFMERFAGLRRAHGIFVITSTDKRRGKVRGRARTVKVPVTVATWQEHLSGKTGLGIVPINDEGVTKFGALDIDIFDLDLGELETRVVALELPLIVCRTKSGGAHLYLFTQEYAEAKLVRERLTEWAVLLGHPGIEVFPKQVELAGENDVGNWINMPYFGGDETARYAIKNGQRLTVEQFLEYSDTMALSVDGLIRLELKQDDALADGPPCLQYLGRAGFPEGTRNKGLFSLGVLCKIKYGDDWKKKVDEFNQHYMKPPLNSDEVAVLIKSLDKKRYVYTCKEDPLKSACNKKICMNRQFGIDSFQRRGSGVQMDGLVKILTDPPMYLLNVNGRRLRIDSSEDLIVQGRFVRCCVDALNIMPQTITRPLWEDAIRDLLDKVEEVDAPADAGITGQFMFFLEQFCTERSRAANREELLIGKPFTEEGVTYFKSSDLLSFMEKRRLQISAKEAWAILRERGAVTKQFHIKNKCVRCWGVAEFPAQNEPLDVPEIEGDEF